MSPPVAPGAQPTLAVDEEYDSAYEDDSDASFTTSISSSVRAYRNEHGRRYHAYKDGSYAFPNDDIENDRLDLQHLIFLKTLDEKLHLAPIEQGLHNILDVGTGTGIWAMEFADRYPSARTIGTDLSPIQPNFVPPNLSFLVDDAEKEWSFPHKFDYIHGRALLGSFGNWPRFFEQCFENLQPGGWLEMQDFVLPPTSEDGTLTPDHALYKWGHLMVEAADKIGRPMNATLQFKRWMEEAGFVDVQEVDFKWPSNTWPKDPKYKEIGLWNYANLLEGLHGFTIALFTRALGWTDAEVEVFLPGVRDDMRNRKIHAYWPLFITFGRKPEK
ncbi:MAG: hypothetical protein M1839_002450 [Geoglossum umbratile]|nr:MAG: hypothetical protein M1839_002450 [Geoglossum umbratile]